MKNEIKVNFFHVCDYASFSEGGKLNILGIFENINPASFPYTHPQMFIVTNLTFKKSENVKGIIRILDEEDMEIARLELPVNIKIPSDKKVAHLGLLGQINNVKFEKKGKYKLQLLANDEMLEERIIDVPQDSK